MAETVRGMEIFKFIIKNILGDQYLVDLSNTKGHTAAVNKCCWNPLNKDEFLSCSEDG